MGTTTAFVGTSRFEVRATIGRGGTGVVYRVWDRERRCERALKTLATLHPSAIHRLKREFRSLAELTHPNLVALDEMFSEEGVWFFTMELIDGVDFLTYVRHGKGARYRETVRMRRTGELPPGPDAGAMTMDPTEPLFDEERLMRALRQLAHGVHVLHQAGKQHRDLKPANVLVTHDGRVVLLDFGLATDRAHDPLDEDQREGASGTPAYMSPERWSGRPANEASDWYSVGVMIFEVLTGFLPVELGNDADLDGAIGDRIDGKGPEAVVELCRRLLCRDPGERPTGAEVLRHLGEQAAEPLSRESRFVGRETHLAVLRDAFKAVQRGRPAQVQVRGRSGFGKTTLVRHFLRGLQASGAAVVLAGRCYERESVRHKVFDSLIDAIVRHLLNLPLPTVAGLIEPDVAALARMFPALLRVPTVRDNVRVQPISPDPHEVAHRAATALRALLARIGAQQPLVIFVDDLQWGDRDSARLLGHVMSGKDRPLALLLLSFRTEDVDSPVLRTLLEAAASAAADVRELEVGPLSPDEAEALALSTLVINSGLAEGEGRRHHQAGAIAREAAGSPLFVQELARHTLLRADTALRPDADAPVAARFGTMLQERLELLPPPARALVSIVAVAGHPITQTAAFECAGIEYTETDVLRHLRSANLLRTSGPRLTDTVEVYHDRIREEMIGRLPPVVLIEQHRRVAMALERVEPIDAEAVALHWQLAKDPARAAGHTLTAARQAAVALAFDRAAGLFAAALALLELADERRQAARVGLAEALHNAGRGPEAGEAYLAAAEHAERNDALELKRLACEQFLVSGHIDRGLELARVLLGAVHLELPTTPAATLISLLVNRLKIRVRGIHYRAREVADIPPRELTRVDLCWSMATGFNIVDSKLGASFTSRYLLLALAAGEPRRIARGLAMEAAHTATSGNVGRAHALLAKARPMAERGGDDHGRGFLSLMEGFVEYFRGHWREALAAFDLAAQIFRDRCAGVTWETSTAHYFALWALLYLGDWRELCSRGHNLRLEAQRRGNRYLSHGLHVSAGVITALMADDVEGARGELRQAVMEWSQRGFQIQHFLRLYMSGWIDLYAGTGLESWRRINEHWPALRKSLLLQVDDVRLRMLHIRAFSALAMDLDRAHLRAVERDARAISKIRSDGAEGVAALISATVHARGGRSAHAEQNLVRAAEVFDAAEMPLYAAAARYRLGQLGNSAYFCQASEAVLAAQGIARPDRMFDVLAPRLERPT